MKKSKAQPTNTGLWRAIFISPNENRLRAGWRLLIHTLLLGILVMLAGIVIFIPVGLLQISFDSSLAFLASLLSSLVGITVATFLARRFLDKRSIVSLGLKLNVQAAIDVLAGFVIAFFLIGLVYVLELALGWTKFEAFAWQKQSGAAVTGNLALWLLIFIIVGWQEELLSRGYHLQTLESGTNLLWAVIISSSVFGLLHITNPGASWIAVPGVALAGLLLAFPYILTRQLWLSIGLHLGWNFFEGVVFGFPVSGLETFHLLQHTVSGPELWTGGAFGPEAGLLVIPALLLGFLLVYAYTRTQIRKTNPE